MASHDTTYHGPGPAMPGTKPGTDHAVDAHEEHPGERVYITIAIILAVFTGIEVIVYYIDALRDILVPLLLVLSAMKFVAVVGYFMHLKMDDRRLTWIFAGGLITAASIILALMALFNFDERFLGEQFFGG